MSDDQTRSRLACMVCGDDLSAEQLDEGEELSCSDCEDLPAEEQAQRLYRMDTRSRWYTVR